MHTYEKDSSNAIKVKTTAISFALSKARQLASQALARCLQLRSAVKFAQVRTAR